MLHARVNNGSSAWIVSLMYGTEEICVLTICSKETEALEHAQRINSHVVPKQQVLLQKLENTQNVLKSILEKIGPLPTTSDELILSIRKAIKYIEKGKQDGN